MKSATISPAAVMAVVNGPFTPVELCPSPAMFHRQTFVAVAVSSVSMIRISCGFSAG